MNHEGARPRRLFFAKPWWAFTRIVLYTLGIMIGLVWIPAVALDPKRPVASSSAALVPLLLLGMASMLLLWRVLRELAKPAGPRIAIYREGVLFRKPNLVWIKELESPEASRGRGRVYHAGIVEGRVDWADLGEVRVHGFPFFRWLSLQINSTRPSSKSPGAQERVQIMLRYSDRLHLSARSVVKAITFYRRNDPARLALPTWDVTSLAQDDGPPVHRRLRIRTLMLVAVGVALWAALVRGCADMMYASH